jgi:hypothetical protein
MIRKTGIPLKAMQEQEAQSAMAIPPNAIALGTASASISSSPLRATRRSFASP